MPAEMPVEDKPSSDPCAFTESLKYRLYGQYPLPIPPRYVCRIKKEKKVSDETEDN